MMIVVKILQKMQMLRKMRPEICEEAEERSDEEEINEIASGEKQFEKMNNSHKPPCASEIVSHILHMWRLKIFRTSGSIQNDIETSIIINDVFLQAQWN